VKARGIVATGLIALLLGCSPELKHQASTNLALPAIDYLSIDSAGIQLDSPMTVLSRCSNCEFGGTKYQWYVEGEKDPVSLTDYYQLTEKDSFKEISIHATAYNSNDDPGPTEIVTYRKRRFSAIAAGWQEFSLLTSDGEGLVWGRSQEGGYYGTSQVLEPGSGITELQSNHGAAVALLSDGRIKTWRYPGQLIDSDFNYIAAPLELSNVTNIVATAAAFAALKSDGSVVTWGLDDFYIGPYGHPVSVNYGADSRYVSDELVDVKALASTSSAFSALKGDGTVVSWGDGQNGGNNNSVRDQLVDVVSIWGDKHTFVAQKSDGSFIAWGSNAVIYNRHLADLSEISDIVSNGHSTTIISPDGTAKTWSNLDEGAGFLPISNSLRDIQAVVTSLDSFAALKNDGTVVTWGYSEDAKYGADDGDVSQELYDIRSIASTGRGFTALREDGNVFVWGDKNNLHLAHTYRDLSGMSKIFGGSSTAFVGIKSDGSVICWGISTCYPETTKLVYSSLEVPSD
jgi:alpha-tubulin suppressor-like RCC1 family protein